MSKTTVIAVIDKKITTADNDSKLIEKAFYKGGAVGQAAMKDFIDQYMEKRKAFHKYQILKVKVNQS